MIHKRFSSHRQFSFRAQAVHHSVASRKGSVWRARTWVQNAPRTRMSLTHLGAMIAEFACVADCYCDRKEPSDLGRKQQSLRSRGPRRSFLESRWRLRPPPPGLVLQTPAYMPPTKASISMPSLPLQPATAVSPLMIGSRLCALQGAEPIAPKNRQLARPTQTRKPQETCAAHPVAPAMPDAVNIRIRAIG